MMSNTRATITPILATLLIGLLTLFACSAPVKETADQEPRLRGHLPLIIAHRGASGALPEHTLEAYTRAIEHGADFIEPDLVMTRDGVLIARHDRYLSTTTNVADLLEFSQRKRPDPAGGTGSRIDWWVEDFTIAEIKTLRARQPREGRSKAFDDLYAIPTFDEVVALAAQHGVGVYPETKSPSHHASIGLDMKAPLLAALDGFDALVFIQSFEAGILRELDTLSDWPLVQLYSGSPAAIVAGHEPALEDAATYADGTGPYKLAMAPTPGDYVARAHALGLQVHPYTFRADDLPDGMSFEQELSLYFEAGVDGVFTDHAGQAATIRDRAFNAAD